MSDIVEALCEHRVVVIYRGFSTERCRELTATLARAGVRLFEVTMNSPTPTETIRALRGDCGSDVRIGAGTVTDPGEVTRVAEAGAEFVISPHLDSAVVAATKDAGLAAIPGAFTPTEVLAAARAGADLVKVFPIRPVGPDYLRQLRGPLPDVPLVATGGVDAELAGRCLAAGATGVAIGVHLLGADPAARADPATLTRAVSGLLDVGI
jgi:2-dehydro-3-deoxyphosphogluconate aldolase/(4S)-4-hydroxy-2-oxoglutarate aldolase